MRIRDVYISLGSNLGDRVGHMRQAVRHMRALIDIAAVSQIYAAAPLGYVRDDASLNAVVYGRTLLSPIELLIGLQKIERALGCSRVQYGPRPIDLDILFYESAIIQSYRLTVPHPHMQDRGFILKPLAELAPNFMHPVLYYTPVQLLHDAEDAAAVRMYDPATNGKARQVGDVLT